MSKKENSKSPWIPVGELQEGFAPDANILKLANDLVGETLTLHFSDGAIIEHEFSSINKLTWTIKNGSDEGLSSTETYSATSLRKGIFFVDFIKHTEKATTITIILDLNKKVFTALIAKMPTFEEANKPLIKRVADNEELTAVKGDFIHGTINNQYDESLQHHTKTDELVGKRVFYEYSPHEKYEHIYLNPNMYSWQCVEGVEKGLADTDTCHYYKIDEELYWFVWREKIVPTIGVVMIDLSRKKTTGKIMGYTADDFTTLSNFPIGAYARVLNQTKYDV